MQARTENSLGRRAPSELGLSGSDRSTPHSSHMRTQHRLHRLHKYGVCDCAKRTARTCSRHLVGPLCQVRLYVCAACSEVQGAGRLRCTALRSGDLQDLLSIRRKRGLILIRGGSAQTKMNVLRNRIRRRTRQKEEAKGHGLKEEEAHGRQIASKATLQGEECLAREGAGARRLADAGCVTALGGLGLATCDSPSCK